MLVDVAANEILSFSKRSTLVERTLSAVVFASAGGDRESSRGSYGSCNQ